MALNFNTEPFFDDYSETDNFHRVLFRPGYAVQARELTQLQTILQEQIRRHGDHMFKEGAMVIPGQISYDTNLAFVKLESTVDITNVLEQLVGKEIKNTSGLIAKVVTYTVAETVGLDLEPNTLFVKYMNSLQDVDGLNSTVVFNAGELLSPVDGTSGLGVTVGNDTPTGVGCSATIQSGIYYIRKNFVRVDEQTIVLDKYSSSPSYRVGLRLVEDTIFPEDDESLLDNALGSPNYAAPGACRYKMSLVLDKIVVDTNIVAAPGTDIDFIDLLRLKNGEVQFKIDRTIYSEIDKTLARRTFDESGDYALSQFDTTVREYRNNLRGAWGTSKYFIQGDLIKVPVNVANLSEGYLYFVATTNGQSSASTEPTWSTYQTVENFTDNTVIWEHAPIPQFNNGVYTFATDNAAYNNFTLNDHIHLSSMAAYGVEAGKAYVRGYEIEKIATEYLPVYKSRNVVGGSDYLCDYFGLPAGSLPAITDSVSESKTTTIDMSMGSYIYVTDVKYLPDIKELTRVTLYSVDKATALAGLSTAANIIGSARIRAFEKNANVNGVTTYKVFLFDIITNVGRDLKNIKSIVAGTTAFQCNINKVVDTPTVINAPDDGSLLWSIPSYAVQNISEADYVVVKKFTSTATGTGPYEAVFTAPTGYTFESVFDDDNYIFCESDGDIVTPGTAGEALSIVRTNDTTITLKSDASGVYTMFGSMRRNASSAEGVATQAELTLSLEEGSYTSITPSIVQAKTIELPYPYVTRITAVLMSLAVDSPSTDPFACAIPIYDTNITSRYSFNTGQELSVVKNSSITLVDGYAAPEGPITIQYEYLAYTGSDSTYGHFIGVNSYVHSSSRVRYDQIPQVSSYNLRDSIDFRPFAAGASFVEHYFPKYGSIGSFTYTNALSRIDNVALSSNGTFMVSRGIPSDTPFEPATPKLAMRLAAVTLEPYTFTRGHQVGSVIQRAENKRYTMRDIGKIERRVQDLEYYTTLSMTELDTKNMRIIDEAGLDRYQNGFLVDSFDGQGIGNVASDDWNCSIDSQNRELRPFFSQKQVGLFQDMNYATSYQVTGDLVTMKYTEVPMIVQDKASLTENVNPYALYAWRGSLDITPWSDTWFSTEYRPDIIINDNSQYDAIIAKAEADGVLGTVWNAWQVLHSSTKSLNHRTVNLPWSRDNGRFFDNNSGFWNNWTSFNSRDLTLINRGNAGLWNVWGFGVPTRGVDTTIFETQATETTSSRIGTTSTIVDRVDSRVVDERVVDTSVIPYIRPRTVLFSGYGFKPSTALTAFFDNVPVNDYITPATRFEVTPVPSYPSTFDVERNAGSAASTSFARKIYYDEGATIEGTVTVANGSTAATSSNTNFNRDTLVGNLLNFGHKILYRITGITGIHDLSFTPAYTAPTPVGPVQVKVISDKHNTDETETAFTHGEVVSVSGNTANTGIVVGQEKVLVNGVTKYYIYVLNMKGTFNTGDVLVGEYGSIAPRVTVVSRQDFNVPTTSETGLLCGMFNIPCNPLMRFRTGTRELQFSDSDAATSELRALQQSTVGSGMYVATGTLQTSQRTILATRTAQVVSEQVTETNTVTTTQDRVVRDTGWRDPLAQTFLVQQNGGAFVTSVELYFATRDTKVPVRVEIREVVNGYPGSSVLPFSRVEKKGMDVNVDPSLGATATKFTFPSPVYLQNGIEYALVIVSDSNAYRVWISQTDQIDVITKTRISSQPYNGVLFKSQNSTAWTPDQTQDLKFKLNRALFQSGTATLTLIPPDLSYKDLGYNPLYFTSGTGYMRVIHPNHGHVIGEHVKLKSRIVVTENIAGIDPINIFNRNDLTVVAADIDSYVVNLGYNANKTGYAGGGFICASENFEFSTAMIDIGELVPEGTNIAYSMNTMEHGGSTIINDQVVPKENKSFNSVRIYGSDKISAYGTGTPYDLGVICSLTRNPSMDNLSPVIDLGRLGITLVNNKVDSPYPLSGQPNSTNYETIDYVELIATGEIGAAKPLVISSSDYSTYNDTIKVNISNLSTYDALNKLNIGDFIKILYSTVGTPLYFTIIEKRILGTDLYLTMEYYSDPAVVPLVDTSANTVQILWLSRFKSEVAPLGSSTTSKYVTKKINFSRPSNMLRIMFDAIIPSEADVEVYYKTGLSVSSDFISSRYIKADLSNVYVKSEDEFKAIVIDIERLPTDAPAATLAPFDSVMVKLVMKSINRAKVPRIKNFRVIACAE